MSIGNAVVLDQLPGNEVKTGACTGCGRDPRADQKVIATGMFFDYEGQVVLCDECIFFLGNLVGMEKISNAKTRQSDVRRHERREAKIKALGPAVLALHASTTEIIEELSL